MFELFESFFVTEIQSNQSREDCHERSSCNLAVVIDNELIVKEAVQRQRRIVVHSELTFHIVGEWKHSWSRCSVRNGEKHFDHITIFEAH